VVLGRLLFHLCLEFGNLTKTGPSIPSDQTIEDSGIRSTNLVQAVPFRLRATSRREQAVSLDLQQFASNAKTLVIIGDSQVSSPPSLKVRYELLERI